MSTVAILNRKGGVGKTTLATNLAWGLAEKASVMLLDADPQRSSSDWSLYANDAPSGLTVEPAGQGALITQVRALSRRHDWVIIDGPPGTSNVAADAVRVADVVLIPAKASAFDVWAATDIVHAIKQHQESSPGGKPTAAFVITMAKPRTRLGRQIDAALAQLGLPVLQSRTTDRVAYTQAGNDGSSVLATHDRIAHAEITQIQADLEAMTA